MIAFRSISIKNRLIAFGVFVLTTVLFIGSYSIIKVKQLSLNGVRMNDSSDEVVNGLKTTRDIGELRRFTSEFLTTGSKGAYKKVILASKSLEDRIPQAQKPNLKAFLKDMELLSVRMESFRNNKRLVHKAEAQIVEGIKTVLKECQGNSACIYTLQNALNGFKAYQAISSGVLEGTEDFDSNAVTKIVDAVTADLSKARQNVQAPLAHALSQLENSFFDLDDAISTIVAIEKKVQSKREDVLKKLGLLDQAIMKSSISAGELASRLAKEGEQISSKAFVITVVIGCTSFTLLLAFGYLFYNSIVTPLKKISAILEVMARGDLRNRIAIEGSDEFTEFSRNFNEFLSNISTLVGHVKGASDSVGREAKELSQMSDRMVHEANGAVEASAEAHNQIQEVAEYVHHTSTMVDNLAQATNEIANNTASTASLSENLEGQIQGTRNIIEKLSEHAKDIGDVIELIGSIAEQTNLLALNATIEAARAGEAGKGFAVVANEVKELAKQTAEATDKISPIIVAIQRGVEESVASINESVSAVNVLKDSANTVVAAVEQQTATYSEINEQVQIINERVRSVEEKVKLLAKAAEENLAESRILKDRATVLKENSEELNVQISGLVV